MLKRTLEKKMKGNEIVYTILHVLGWVFVGWVG